ncbi:hypothetical protein GDO78_014639 [Eleutherodactylus coqui]|uniref:CARD domain-containing protein n=1 Tax=Eleutherodactylus coqui TaxID=57060 RepID=A0A8J6B1B2_ELECQ|nr:hypothetical protein GDO78_014639 [Eleutherodactylus coqui]
MAGTRAKQEIVQNTLISVSEGLLKKERDVLEAIEERQAAENLRTDLKTNMNHFVDEHRTELIQRVTLVDPILDDLFQMQLLTQEAYDTVRSINTNQEKMRELYVHVNSWGNEDKDKFLQSLIKHNSPLIRDLEEGNA